MALNQMNKLVWIVTTILKHGRITFNELNRRWMANEDLSGGLEMQKRTFHKWKDNIFDTFGLIIECENHAPFRYCIENAEALKDGSIERWLISTFAVSNSLIESKSIKDRILLEDVPSGQQYLEPVIDAMKKNRFIHITYYNYWREDYREHYVMPLCVKLFRQRWYMVGRLWPSERTLVFSLDRVSDFRLSSNTFDYPKDFVPQEFFEGCIGVIPEADCKIQEVKVKVSAGQANYLRDLPLHRSQEEIERSDEYSIFRFELRPTFDFQQEILWHGEDMEVLEPQWLREEIAGKVERMWEKYSKQEQQKP